MNKVQSKVRPGLITTVMNILCDDANGKKKKGIFLKHTVKNLKNLNIHPKVNILL